ncbi:MAG: SRPBCC domain-containing protein [Chloroflexi bacterium]|nr:SRPBCC domain-containing protein [Chloroflexota bacterium]
MTAERTRPSLIFNATVNASPESVFEAFFSTPERWLCRHHTIEVRVGGSLKLCWPDGCYEGSFVQCEPPTLARFSWRIQGEPSMPETMVVVRADAADSGATALELEHYGFGVGPDWDPLYVGAARAWGAYLKNLRAVLEAGVDLREPNE